ncbi:MAG: hypothetical protein US82_C0023G0006 [Parcubacteria group bacterium GW2011_GWC1_38_22]|nr:MAG: hypothetical protein US82_C0023G0006 [Parcubacteria group bacterium GW2011_GWC1_38_22]
MKCIFNNPQYWNPALSKHLRMQSKRIIAAIVSCFLLSSEMREMKALFHFRASADTKKVNTFLFPKIAQAKM